MNNIINTIKTLIDVKRINNSCNNNPNYILTFNDSSILKTSNDYNINYAIGSFLINKDLNITYRNNKTVYSSLLDFNVIE